MAKAGAARADEAISTTDAPEVPNATAGDDAIAQTVERLVRSAGTIGIGRLAYFVLPWLPASKSFRAVAAEYVKLHHPPMFESYLAHGTEYTPAEAAHSVKLLAWKLHQLHDRLAAAAAGEGVEWERKLNARREAWGKKQRRVVELLEKAAELIDSGQIEPSGFDMSVLHVDVNGNQQFRPAQSSDLYPTLTGYKEHEKSAGHDRVDEVAWCGTDNLRRWAKLIRMSPVEVVFPQAGQSPKTRLYRPESIGTRGRASNSDSALCAMTVRQIAEHVPKAMLSRGGYAAIADLATQVGARVKDRPVKGEYVRSLLQRGHS